MDCTLFILPLGTPLFTSLHLWYTETYPLCLFNMLCFLWNIYSIQSVVISYLWAHNHFRCTFHRGALILRFSLYLFMYLPNFPPPMYSFYCFITLPSILLTIIPPINLFTSLPLPSFIIEMLNFRRPQPFKKLFLWVVNDARAFYI